MRPVRHSVFVVALATLTPVVAAAESHPCAATVDPAARLACYDKAFPPGPGARYGDVGMSPAEREAKRQQAVRDFGLSGAQTDERKSEAQREVEREIHPDRIEAGITKVSYRATGERVLTLDNGQVWMIIEVTEKGFLKTGDRIAIKNGMLPNTYMLDTGRINLRARRIQ